MIPSAADARIILTHLLEIGVYALVIFAAVLAFRLIFHNRTKPALRYGLWFLLLLRLTVPFTVNSAIHLIVLPAAGSTAATVTTQTEATAQPVHPEMVTAPPSRPATDPDAASTPSHATQEKRASAPGLSIWQWLVMVWLLGAGALLLRRAWMRGLLAARIRARGRTPAAQDVRAFRELCRSLDVRRPVRLLLMEDIASPALTIGLRPTVLLPASLTGEDREQERRFALLHELTHLRRGDHLVMLWYGALRCLWWFHPVVYLMEKPFRMDMESACDAEAVKGMSRQEKLAYAALLLELSGEQTL